MSPQAIGVLGLACLLGLILGRVPVAVAMGLVGLVGYAAIEGWTRALFVLGGLPSDMTAAYPLSVVPLFILMGAFASESGMSADLFRGTAELFSRRRGALAMATIGASAAFSAVSGSSLATVATMGRIAIPEMTAAGYDRRLAAGSVAAGGTLGILIPPSVILLIYAIIAEQPVRDLFASSLIPGAVLALLYLGVILVIGRLRPDWAPAAVESRGRRHGQGSVRGLVQVAGLFVVSVGGIYAGLFSPTEAAAVGAFGAFVIALARRRMTWRDYVAALTETVSITAVLFFIIMASNLFSYFIVQTHLATGMVEWMRNAGLSPLAVILFIVVAYVVLGCFLDGIGMVLVTVPLFLPLAQANGFNPIWFGVLLVIVIEVGLVTPPVGMNLFVLRAQAPEVPMASLFLGVMPFLLMQVVLIALLVAFPGLALWLPGVLS